MGRCWLWGEGPPQTFSAQVGYLPGLSVWSLHVHKGFPPHRTPTQKHAKRLLSCPVPDQDWTEHVDWRPCAVKGCPLLLEPLEEGQGLQDGLKAEGIFHRRPHQHACVCVCVLCRRQMHVCGVVCCVTIKNDFECSTCAVCRHYKKKVAFKVTLCNNLTLFEVWFYWQLVLVPSSNSF